MTICVVCHQRVDLESVDMHGVCKGCTEKIHAKPKVKTFEEWIKVIEEINAQNIRDYNQIMLTTIQWQELKGIINAKTKEGD